MKLLTAELLQQFAEQTNHSNKTPEDTYVIAKFFFPLSNASWFATDYYPEDRLFFGWANLGDDEMAELGYFSLDELESTNLPLGIRIERDLHFGRYTLKQVMDGETK